MVHFILDPLARDYFAKVVDMIDLRYSHVLDMMDAVLRSSRALIIFEVARLTDDLENGMLCWAGLDLQSPVVGS